jgi:hypothetical protein
MRASADTRPETQEPPGRDVEQEVAAGRTAGTPAGLLLAVVVTVGCLVLVALALVAVAYFVA